MRICRWSSNDPSPLAFRSIEESSAECPKHRLLRRGRRGWLDGRHLQHVFVDNQHGTAFPKMFWRRVPRCAELTTDTLDLLVRLLYPLDHPRQQQFTVLQCLSGNAALPQNNTLPHVFGPGGVEDKIQHDSEQTLDEIAVDGIVGCVLLKILALVHSNEFNRLTETITGPDIDMEDGYLGKLSCHRCLLRLCGKSKDPREQQNPQVQRLEHLLLRQFRLHEP